MTASKIFLYFCLSFIGGIFLNSVIQIPQLLMLAFLILGILFISVLWPHKNFVVIGFCILFLVSGIWQHQGAELRSMKSELRSFNDTGETITLIGVVFSEPDIREKSQKLTIEIKQLNYYAAGSRSEKEKVLATINRYPEYQYGDKLKITGKLETPPVYEDFNYKDYLAKDGIYSVMDWPEIELIEKNQENFVYAKILNFKNKLRESIYQNLSPPQSSILGAIILGDKSRMSGCSQKEIEAAQEKGEECLKLKEKLNITGVRHITAISGMHITILSIILMQILISLGLWRGQAFYITLTLLILFIVMVGLAPSAIRAGIMGGLFLLAQKIGRLSAASRAIVFACAGMLAVNPLLLRLDVGFQLSFLAVMGIIYLMPIFQYYFLKWLPIEWFQKCWWLSWLPIKTLGSLLAMTLVAQVFTLPILIYNFGYFSLIAPITNILIVPLLPYIMGFGFIFSLVGIIFQPLGWILSWPVWLLLSYLTKIIDWLSSISWAFKTLEISWIWLAISYLILGLITWRLQERQKLKFLNY